MRICLIHNEYGKVSGEEIVVRGIDALLVRHGHQVSTLIRSSAELDRARLGKAKAFFTGIYNFSSARTFRQHINTHRPDVVHVHNLFPLISPSVLVEARRANLPVVMTVHNYRLVCPNGLHMVNGQVCERCVGGREYHCVQQRCEGSLFKSLGYAVRNTVARRMRLFLDNVTMYAALTEFQRSRLISAGFPADRIVVIPNAIDTVPPAADVGDSGRCVGYVGRVSREKNVPGLLAAAAACPDIEFRIAGSYDSMPDLIGRSPHNVVWEGHIGPDKLDAFYRNARILVLPSTCFEGFPTVLLEAMAREKPVICSRIGGLPEIVDDGVTGLLVRPGDDQDLTGRIRQLWNDPQRCRTMGQAGRLKVLERYSSGAYHDRLLAIYHQAIAIGPNRSRAVDTSLTVDKSLPSILHS